MMLAKRHGSTGNFCMDKYRPLTGGEIEMAHLLYRDGIDYGQVRIYREPFLPFGLQGRNTAIAPNGNIYFHPERCSEDFSDAPNNDKHFYMHEMAHVWQKQLGYPVMLRGAIRIGLPYTYTLFEDRQLGDYNMEAQGDLLADYFALKFLRDPQCMAERMRGIYGMTDIALYEKVLRNFLADPVNRRNRPRYL
jgi:hypothetical protein